MAFYQNETDRAINFISNFYSIKLYQKNTILEHNYFINGKLNLNSFINPERTPNGGEASKM